MIFQLPKDELIQILIKAMDSIEEGVLIADAQKQDLPIIYANKGCYKLTGYSKEEMLGKNCRFLQGPESDKKEVDKIRASIKNSTSSIVELINYKKDGTRFWNHFSITPIKDHKGKITHFVGIQRDVTTKKRLMKRNYELNAMKTTLQTINDLIYNFMNALQYFRSHLGVHTKDVNQILKEFDKEYNDTFKKFKKINELEEFKEKQIGERINVLDLD